MQHVLHTGSAAAPVVLKLCRCIRGSSVHCQAKLDKTVGAGTVDGSVWMKGGVILITLHPFKKDHIWVDDYFPFPSRKKTWWLVYLCLLAKHWASKGLMVHPKNLAEPWTSEGVWHNHMANHPKLGDATPFKSMVKYHVSPKTFKFILMLVNSL